jgi:hypothetical protein
MKARRKAKKIKFTWKQRFQALESDCSQLRYDLYMASQKLQSQMERAGRYFKRLHELKAKISDLDLLLKFDNYTEDEAYEIPMPELRQLANDQLSGQLTKDQLMRK